jgi:hypothetical protein
MTFNRIRMTFDWITMTFDWITMTFDRITMTRWIAAWGHHRIARLPQKAKGGTRRVSPFDEIRRTRI